MSTTRDTGFLRNAVQVTNQGIDFVSGSTLLMSISSSGAVTTTGVISGSNALSASYSISSSYSVSSSYAYTASSAVSASYVLNAVSASYAYTASSATNATSASKAVSSSYSDTASFANNFTVLGNLTVFGTQSVQYITSSQLNVSDNVITVNVASPGVRFGGLSVFDSGSLSSEATASLFWDSQENHWIYQRESGSTYNGGMLISGPRNFAGLGNEQGTTSGSLMKGQGGDHVTSSAIFEDGYKATFYNNSLVVSSSGFVGIGTSNPTGSLDISGSVYIRSSSGGVLYIPRMADQSRGLSIGEQTSLGSKSAVIRTAGGVSEHLFLDPGFNNSNVAGNIALVYANTGSVGIGTYLPGAKLEIQSPRNSTLLRLTATSGENWDFKNTNTVGSTDVLSIGPAGATVNLSLKDDSSVGIGTSSPAFQLDVAPGTASATVRAGSWAIMQNVTTNQAMFGYNAVYATSVGSGWRYVNNGYAMAIRMHDAFGTGDMMFHLGASGTAGAAIDASWDTSNIKMIIKNDGKVGIGTTTPNYIVDMLTSANNSLLYLNQSNGAVGGNAALIANINTTGGYLVLWRYGGTTIGSITTNGSATAYNTTSDYRLKEDLNDFNGLEKISAIKVYDFKWKGKNDRQNGVIAHELAEVLPYAVNGEKDQLDKEGNVNPQGVDYSMIVPSLVKAIQELKLENDSLKEILQRNNIN